MAIPWLGQGWITPVHIWKRHLGNNTGLACKLPVIAKHGYISIQISRSNAEFLFKRSFMKSELNYSNLKVVLFVRRELLWTKWTEACYEHSVDSIPPDSNRKWADQNTKTQTEFDQRYRKIFCCISLGKRKRKLRLTFPMSSISN